MFDLDAITNRNNKDDGKKWPYRMLIIGPSGSYLYAKDLSEPKYQFLIKKREDAGIKNLGDPSEFIEYSDTMGDVYNNIDDYNRKRKRKILIIFDDMIANIMTNKKIQIIIIELFLDAEN